MKMENNVFALFGTTSQYYPGIYLEEPRKNTKNLSHNSRFPGRNLKPGTPEYEAGVSTTGL
jgi:hypothetical protein